jgi:hypothetical protein
MQNRLQNHLRQIGSRELQLALVEISGGQVKSIIETKANFSGSSATNPQEWHNSCESMPKMEIPDDV